MNTVNRSPGGNFDLISLIEIEIAIEIGISCCLFSISISISIFVSAVVLLNGYQII
jgi:hypothetical protein